MGFWKLTEQSDGVFLINESSVNTLSVSILSAHAEFVNVQFNGTK